MLATTPPMGWNTWNTFGRNIDADLIVGTARAMVDTGLQAAGYEYIVIDDVWQGSERVDGRLGADPTRFPGGIKPLANEIHGMGLKLGIYSSAGTLTCEGELASYGNEEIDAQTFAEWEIDFLKYDYCHLPPGIDGPGLYRKMAQALRSTGRDIILSMCEWGVNQPWNWGASVGAHMWRTTEDIFDSWESIVEIGFGPQADLHPFAGPGRWNDPDMLVVGMYGAGNVGRGGCSDAEYRTHFTQWCLLAAPLMIGCDIRSMTAATEAILLNREVIAVNQDLLGVQARKIGEQVHQGDWSQVWAKPLADGSIAVGLYNLGDKSRKVSAAFEPLGVAPDRSCLVRDIWAGEDRGVHQASYATEVESHGTALLRITPQR